MVSRGLPAVVAMQYAITDSDAIEFARAFYESLADGYPVDASVAEARKAMSFAFEQTVEWGVPVLYIRAQDGVLFEVQEPTVRLQQVISLSTFSQKQTIAEGDLSHRILDAIAQTLGRGGFTGIDNVVKHTDLSREIVEREITDLQLKQLVIVEKTLGGIWAIGLTDGGEAQLTINRYREYSKDSPLPSAPSSLTTHPSVMLQSKIENPRSKIIAPQPFDDIEWIEIPAGEFWMGAAEHDKEAYDVEKPLHKLYLPTYWIAKTPIINAQYLSFVQQSNYTNPNHWRNGRYPDYKADHPVVTHCL